MQIVISDQEILEQNYSGIKDYRDSGLGWLVVDKRAGRVIRCCSRAEARREWNKIK